MSTNKQQKIMKTIMTIKKGATDPGDLVYMISPNPKPANLSVVSLKYLKTAMSAMFCKCLDSKIPKKTLKYMIRRIRRKTETITKGKYSLKVECFWWGVEICLKEYVHWGEYWGYHKEIKILYY